MQGRDPKYHRTNRVAVSNDALTRSYRIPTLRSITSRSHPAYVYSLVLLPVKRNSIHFFSVTRVRRDTRVNSCKILAIGADTRGAPDVPVVIYFAEGRFLSFFFFFNRCDISFLLSRTRCLNFAEPRECSNYCIGIAIYRADLSFLGSVCIREINKSCIRSRVTGGTARAIEEGSLAAIPISSSIPALRHLVEFPWSARRTRGARRKERRG